MKGKILKQLLETIKFCIDNQSEYKFTEKQISFLNSVYEFGTEREFISNKQRNVIVKILQSQKIEMIRN